MRFNRIRFMIFFLISVLLGKNDIISNDLMLNTKNNLGVKEVPSPGYIYQNNSTREEGILIVDLDQTPQGALLKSAIESIYDGVVDLTTDFPENNLLGRDAVFVLLGIFPENVIILPAGAPIFIDYINSGGNLYMEGGDMWYWDPQYGGYDFGPEFGISGLQDGSGDLTQIVGQGFLEGYNWSYTGENNYIDRLAPTGNAVTIFSNETAMNPYDCGIANDSGDHRTIGTSFEITGLGGTNNLEDAVGDVLEFFDI